MAPRPIFRARMWLGAALAVLAACGRGADDQVAARVGDEAITVQEVADYMRSAGYGPDVKDVEKAVGEMIQMELVALRARSQHRLTPAESLQVEEWREMLLLNQFREDVIWKNVQVDEAKLREWYDQNVGEEVSARHILISVPPTAPDSARQGARARADSLLKEVKAGADFAALAEAHSDDEGSAQRGGSLGYFGRGQMVEAFERAAFGTAEGESAPEVVETQFGYHIIKVDDRRKRSFEDLREEIEEQLALPGRQQAEQAYITRMMETSGIEFFEENVDRLIALVDENPPTGPTAEERKLDLATYAGGAVELGEIWDLFELLPEGNRRSIASLDQANMIAALSSVVQRRLLLAKAREGKTEIDSVRQGQLDERIDQLYAEAYLNEAAQSRLEVADPTVRQYYDEHSEFYQGQPFEQVREQIRAILIAQRREALNSADAQRELIAAVADSQAAAIEVERFPDHYGNVLPILREQPGQTATASR